VLPFGQGWFKKAAFAPLGFDPDRLGGKKGGKTAFILLFDVYSGPGLNLSASSFSSR